MKNNDHIDLVKSYFDDNAQSWHDYYHSGDSLTDILLVNRKEIAVGFVCEYVQPGSKILDAGCGAGVISLELVKKGFTLHGWDISPEMLERCEQNFSQEKLVLSATEVIPSSKYSFSLGDVLEANLPDGSFDGILALGFLQYQKDEVKALKQFHRLLKPGGTLVLSGPVKAKISNYFGLLDILRAQKRKLARRSGSKTQNNISLLHQISVHGYSYSRFRQLLKAANFEFVDYRGHGYAHFEVIDRRLGFKGRLFLHNTFTRLSRILPIRRFANDMVVVAKKIEDQYLRS
ncbi:MAG: class I SAM-dependent methyltransferase [Anaerolineales bacterium]